TPGTWRELARSRRARLIAITIDRDLSSRLGSRCGLRSETLIRGGRAVSGQVAACVLSAVVAGCAVPAATSSSTRTQRERTFVHHDAMGKPAEAHLPALPGTFAPPEGVEQVPRARRGVKAPPTRLGRLRADLAGL